MKGIQNTRQRKKEEKKKRKIQAKRTKPNQTKQTNKQTYKQKYKQNKHTNKQTNKTKTKQKRRGGKGNKATCLNHFYFIFFFSLFLAAETSDPQGNRKCSGFEGQDVMKIFLFLFFPFFFLFLLICIPEATFRRRQADDAWARCAETCWVLAAVKTSTIRPNTRPPRYPAPRQLSHGSVVIFVRWMPRFKGLTTK